jgi:hypothetical protein
MIVRIGALRPVPQSGAKPGRGKNYQRRNAPYAENAGYLDEGDYAPLGIAAYAIGVAQKAFGAEVLIGKPDCPLDKIRPPWEEFDRQREKEKKNRVVGKIIKTNDESGKGVESAQPVIEQLIRGITVERPPKNRGREADTVQQYKNGNIGDPCKKGDAVFNKQIGESAGKQQNGKGGKTKIGQERPPQKMGLLKMSASGMELMRG